MELITVCAPRGVVDPSSVHVETIYGIPAVGKTFRYERDVWAYDSDDDCLFSGTDPYGRALLAQCVARGRRAAAFWGVDRCRVYSNSVFGSYDYSLGYPGDEVYKMRFEQRGFSDISLEDARVHAKRHLPAPPFPRGKRLSFKSLHRKLMECCDAGLEFGPGLLDFAGVMCARMGRGVDFLLYRLLNGFFADCGGKAVVSVNFQVDGRVIWQLCSRLERIFLRRYNVRCLRDAHEWKIQFD